MKAIVAGTLVNEHNVPQQVAEWLVNNSTFNEMVEEYPTYVGHYSAQYWANQIVEEFKDIDTTEQPSDSGSRISELEAFGNDCANGACDA